jgi:hypothetical protein
MGDAKKTNQNSIIMDSTAQSIKGILNNLRVQVSVLDAEIKADIKGKADYDKVLKVLEARKLELLARVEHNKAWATNYEAEMGPSMDSFGEMTKEIGIIYQKAKVGHTAGIKLLEKEFGYHPTFKRPGDTFYGIPYRPL